MQTSIIILIFSFFVPISVNAQSKDPVYGQALQQTQTLMVNPSECSKAIESNADLQKADQQLKGVAKDASTEQEYFELMYFELMSQIISNYSSADNDQALVQDIQKGLTNS